MKIFNKLIAGFLTIAFIILLSSLFGIWNIHRVNESLKYVTTKAWVAANSAMQISIDNLTRIMAEEEHFRGSKDLARQWLDKSEKSFRQNMQILRLCGLADINMIDNIQNFYEKLNKLNRRTILIYSLRNKIKLQLDENTIIWTKSIERLKYKLNSMKELPAKDRQKSNEIIIDTSILSLSERAAINNFISGFLNPAEYSVLTDQIKNNIKRRLDELDEIKLMDKQITHPIQDVRIETERLLDSLYTHHNSYRTLRTDLTYSTMRLVESLEIIKDMMNTKMDEAALEGKHIAKTSQLYFIIFTVLGFIVSIIAGFSISRIITNPIIRLKAATENLADGNLHEKVRINSKDEIGALGESFNKMSEELKLFTEEIKHKNIQLEETNQKLIQANKELHVAIDELQLKTIKLDALNKDLEDSAKLKSEFLANMSHELRTPLSSIIGYTKLVLKNTDSDIPEEQRHNLLNVITSAEHLLKLINDILNLSKIEAGKMQVSAIPFYIEEMIDATIALVKPIANEKGLIVDKHISNDLPKLFTDQEKIKEILQNLLSNSIKFTAAGKIAVSTKRILGRLKGNTATDCVMISVKDTGIGIAEKDRELIFEDFCQADGSITRSYSGTGLGLSIAKKLIELIGGEIKVESSLGEGSTFSFIFPVDIQIENELKKREKHYQILTKGFKTLVLVIEDNKETINTIDKIAGNYGFQIVEASTGNEGIEMAKSLRPDIITIDILLPQKNGWDVIKELRMDPQTKDIPVIIISNIDNKEKGTRYGVNEYIVKPINKDNLLSTFNKYIPKTRKTILIVENDMPFYDEVKSDLTREGFLVVNAHDGKSGIELLGGYRPNVIVSEIDLPNNDGYKFANEIKNNTEFSSVPLIALASKQLDGKEKDKFERLFAKIIQKNGKSYKNISEELIITLKAIAG